MTKISSRLFFAVLIIKIFAVIAVAIFVGPSGFLWSGDAKEYIDLGRNIVSGNGFARTTNGELVPAQDRMPLYPFVVGLLMKSVGFHSAWPVALLQALLAAFIALLTYRIAGFFMAPKWALIPALLVSFEPLISMMHLLIFAETLLVFFVLLFIYFFLKYLETNRHDNLAIAALALSLALFTKPVALYLFLIPFGVLLWRIPRYGARGIVVAAAVMIFILFPWVARNSILFDTFGLNTYGSKALCGYQLSAVFATANHFVDTTPGIAMARVREYPAYQELNKKCFVSSVPSTLFALLRVYPVAFIKANTLAAAGFFTNEGLNTIFEKPSSSLPPHHNYLTPAVFSGNEWGMHLRQAFTELSLFGRMVVSGGKLFWIVTDALAFIGIIGALRNPAIRAKALFLTLVIFYFAAANILAAGFGAGARYRYHIDALLFIFAVLGFLRAFFWRSFYTQT